jgi:hypothetical protein
LVYELQIYEACNKNNLDSFRKKSFFSFLLLLYRKIKKRKKFLKHLAITLPQTSSQNVSRGGTKNKCGFGPFLKFSK